MKGIGIALLIAGVLIMGGAFLYDPTVTTDSSMIGGTYLAPQQVYNLGALQLQELGFLGGMAAFLAGAMFLAIGELAERMELAGTAKSPEQSTNAALEENPCTFCDRNVFPYKACSSAADKKNEARAAGLKDPVCRTAFQAQGWLPTEQAEEMSSGSSSPNT